MNESFSFNSQIKNIQNSLISQNIRDVSNLELLNSEEAIRNVIKSYTDKFNALGGVLIDISKFIVNSKDVIRTKDFNDLFEGIYIDLFALYRDLSIVNNVMDLNLQRNKNYFLIMKKRIRDLWNRLNLTRSYIYDGNPSDESYYEAFSTDINAKFIKDILIDKKIGYLYQQPINYEVHNKSFQIKTIISTTYPEPNDNGGVFKSTNILNTFEDNYINGPRDMLQNGLWKEEIYTNVIPSLTFNIGSNEVPIYRSYKGIVSLIDIEYSYQIEFNKIDFDIFGDKPLNIDAILYKQIEDEPWKVVNFKSIDMLNKLGDIFESKKYAAKGNGFDVLSLSNIDKVSAKYLRIVVNQENYIHMNSNSIESSTLESKINNDLSERRYETVKFNKDINSFLSIPVNDENKSLYNKIIDIIETTSSIEKVLQEIQELIIPKTNIVDINFSNILKYEIGLWSIEPKLELYSFSKGSFDSNPYKLNDKSLISISLNTKQSIPGASTINWYASVNDKNIPLLENSSNYRKEVFSPFNVNNYSNLNTWSSGVFIQLDFPLDCTSVNDIVIYTNGELTTNVASKICFLNSRLLFVYNILDVYKSNYVIRYPVSLYKTVNLYVLSPKPSIDNTYNFVSLGIISTKREILNAFINDIKYITKNVDGSDRYLSDDFIVTNAISSIEEAKDWFGEEFNTCLFVDSTIIPYLDVATSEFGRYADGVRTSISKLSTTNSNVISYIGGSLDGLNNLTILGPVPNLAPLPNTKEI